MNMISKNAILAIILLVSTHLPAQNTSFRLGVRLGYGVSVNKGMDKILVPEGYYSNYTFKDMADDSNSWCIYSVSYRWFHHWG